MLSRTKLYIVEGLMSLRDFIDWLGCHLGMTIRWVQDGLPSPRLIFFIQIFIFKILNFIIN